jgi:microcin C transport system permease protein
LALFRLTPLDQRRLTAFRANRRGWWSLWIFLVVFFASLGAEFLANDRPLLISYKGALYVPVLVDYPETTFDGDFETFADYRDPFIADKINADGWMVWPPIRYDYKAINFDTTKPAPAPPSAENLLGTDDQGRDVLARIIYGLRISILFGVALTLVSSVIGIAVGAVQGFFGGKTDLIGQRFLEIWGSLPSFLILIIVASVITPGFWTLLAILTLFSWTSLVGLVRAEFLRARNFDYVRAARALGMGSGRIMWKHLLPNAMVATLTFTPFILNGSIVALTALDFVGLGLPPGSASLGDLLRQGKDNLQAPWLGMTGFIVTALLLSLLIFVGEAVRDAFDPRKTRA